MARELISKVTRNEFREVLVGFSLREIHMIFEGAGINVRVDFEPNVVGERRGLVEKYYASIDFCSFDDVRKLTAAFEEIIEQLEQAKSEGSDRAASAIQTLRRRMERDGFHYANGRFVADPRLSVIEAPSLVGLSEESIREQFDKARAKIAARDHAGAITSSYTLVEGFLKELLRRTGTPFNEDEGDIRELYRIAAEPLNLNPKGETLESYVKTILQGLRSQVRGFYELANKASDRHARRYNPERHHAKLAVNAAFTLCEFLIDSFEYQKERKQEHTERRRSEEEAIAAAQKVIVEPRRRKTEQNNTLPELRDFIRSRRAALGGFMQQGASLNLLDGDLLTVTPRSNIYERYLRDNRNVIAELASEFYGRPIKVELVITPDAP
jgi:Abortive infection C-terminus